MEDRNIYQDIAERTQGDIYIGVVAVSYTHLTLPTIRLV